MRYLTQLKHPVQDVGRPMYKSPDLQKVQEIVDQIKSIDFSNLDSEESTIKNNEEEIESIATRLSRNALDKKLKKDYFQKSKVFASDGKQKRKSSGLFASVDLSASNKLIELPVEKSNEDSREVREPQVVQPSENERLLTDLNNFQSRLNADQQLDISNFLDHINDKPKPFKFDTTPFLMSQMEKLNHPIAEEQNNPLEDEDLFGARKFFDFNSSPVKRSTFNSEIEDYQKIAKLKSKLIAEYREHHPIVDYSDILRRIDASNQKSKMVRDDFLDHNYRLNDGSSNLDDVMKPFHSDQQVLSPYELNLSFKLENEFKELDQYGQDRDKSKDDSMSGEVPLYKPETDLNIEDEEISP